MNPNQATHLPRPVRAVVCDLDGTLLDTERLYRIAFTDALAAFGLHLPPGAYDELVGLPTTARRALLPALLGDAADIEGFLASYYARRAELVADGIALRPGAAALLDTLDAYGLEVAIATSASAATAAAHLRLAGLAGRFARVVTRDDVARGKPAPDSFLQAARLLGTLPAHCLAIEDSEHGVAAAHAAGMMVVMVPDLVPAAPATVRRCHLVTASLADVSALLSAAPGEPARGNDRSRLRVQPGPRTP